MDNGASSYRRFLDGDECAFDGIMQALFHSLVFFINRYVQELDTAEDIAMDVFATAKSPLRPSQPDLIHSSDINVNISSGIVTNGIRWRASDTVFFIPEHSSTKDCTYPSGSLS